MNRSLCYQLRLQGSGSFAVLIDMPRYRHGGIALNSESLASSSEMCVSLYRLGSNTKKKFEEAKILRSRNTPLTAL